MDYSGLAFPKISRKKKRKRHRKSIMQEKTGQCYLCMKQGDYSVKYTEKHHVIFGRGNRDKSEEYGLTVNLCPLDHRDHKEGVHHNQAKREELAADAQRAFEEHFPDLDFYEIFQINYL